MKKHPLGLALLLTLVGLGLSGCSSQKTFTVPAVLGAPGASLQARWAEVATHMGLDPRKPAYIVQMQLHVEPDGLLQLTTMQIRGTRLGDKHEALYQAGGGPVHWVWLELDPDYKPICGEAESQSLFTQLDQLHIPDSAMKLTGPADFYLMDLQRWHPTPSDIAHSPYWYVGQHDTWRPATASDAPDQHIPVLMVSAMHRQPSNPNTASGGGVPLMLPEVTYQRHGCLSESQRLNWIP